MVTLVSQTNFLLQLVSRTLFGDHFNLLCSFPKQSYVLDDSGKQSITGVIALLLLTGHIWHTGPGPHWHTGPHWCTWHTGPTGH